MVRTGAPRRAVGRSVLPRRGRPQPKNALRRLQEAPTPRGVQPRRSHTCVHAKSHPGILARACVRAPRRVCTLAARFPLVQRRDVCAPTRAPLPCTAARPRAHSTARSALRTHSAALPNSNPVLILPASPTPPLQGGAGRWGRCGAARGRAISAAAPGAPPPRAARGRPAPPHAAMVSAYPPPAPPALHFPSSALITPSSLPSLRPSGHRDERGAPVGAGGSPAVRVPGGGGGGLGRAAPRWRRNGGGLTPRAR